MAQITDLQIGPTPRGSFGIFEAGKTTYDVIEAGYAWPQCDKPVRGGIGTVPFKHRFDYCQCLMVFGIPNQIGTKS
jgi:hypothetical protein